MIELIDLVGLTRLGPQETMFMRACLLDGDAVAVAWSGWRATTQHPRSEIAGRPEIKVLLPLLHDGLRAAGVDALELAPYLRTARLRERHRAQAVAEVANQVAAALADAEVATTLIGGFALANTVYADPGLRHCHDIDLVVDPTDCGRAMRALARAGFDCHDSGAGIALAPRRAIAPGGLPVVVHPGPVSMPTAGHGELLSQILVRPESSGSRRLLQLVDAVLLLRAGAGVLDRSRVAPPATSLPYAVRALTVFTAVDAVDDRLVPPDVTRALRRDCRGWAIGQLVRRAWRQLL